MKVTDILRVKGNTLYTAQPEQALADAVNTMAELDIGSLPVMEHGDLVGMLTFREVISAIVANGGSVGERRVRSVMDDAQLTCTPETEIDEVPSSMRRTLRTACSRPISATGLPRAQRLAAAEILVRCFQPITSAERG